MTHFRQSADLGLLTFERYPTVVGEPTRIRGFELSGRPLIADGILDHAHELALEVGLDLN
jgi:hypothetical protein